MEVKLNYRNANGYLHKISYPFPSLAFILNGFKKSWNLIYKDDIWKHEKTGYDLKKYT